VANLPANQLNLYFGTGKYRSGNAVNLLTLAQREAL
jgi:hypothetical protein